MTFLELVQRLWLESGASGASPGPSTVVSQSGEYARLVTWTKAAWNDIQTAHRDWGWMRATASFTSVSGQAVYPLGTGAGTVGVTAANFGMWARGTGRNYDTAAGTNSETFLEDDSYEGWRDTFQFGALRNTTSRPTTVAVSPVKALCLGPTTAAGYTITHDYFTAPVQLVLDGDEPAMPSQFHEAIVWRALMYYGNYEAAADVTAHGEREFDRIMERMTADRMPELTFCGAIA